MLRINKIKLLFIVIVFFMQACYTPMNTMPVVKNKSYSQSQYKLHPEFKVFHENDNQTKLYYKLFTDELKFSKANPEGLNKAIIKVSYLVTPSFVDKKLLDSSSFILNLRYIKNQTSIVSFINFKDIRYKDYIITIKFFDLYGNRKSTDYIRVNRSLKDNSQYYLTLKKNNLKPIFNDYLNINDTILVRYKDENKKKLYIKYYNKSFEPPIPPFYTTFEQSNAEVYPDSTWHTSFNLQGVFKTGKKGIYRIQADSASNNGMIKLVYDNDYPILKSSAALAEALQYLLSSEEYIPIIQSDNIKLAVDNFWLKCAGNTDKARELLKIWYSRGIYSNYYFTSYKEGWKTDRGMIYMVFGAPHNVKYNDYGEQWLYYDAKGDRPIYFTFIKQANSISRNDYVLKRSVSYQSFWYRAVDSWRKGNVYIYQK